MPPIRYRTPAPQGQIGRTDEGVDWSTKPGSPIVAIGASIVDFVGRYRGFGNYVAAHLTSGPQKGQEIYYAEFAEPTVRVGQRLRPGQQIGVAAGGLEVGFAQRGGTYLPLAQVEGGYREGQQTDAGKRFRNLIGGQTTTTLGKLWIDNGGPPKLANLMAAIALAESGGRVDAEHTNSDGSVDYGLWQIDSVHKQYDPDRLKSDADYNAQAAVAVYRSQGLGAWTTYTSGAYRDYLHGAARHSVVGGGAPITRPGGEDANADPGAAAAAAQDIAWHDYLVPGFLGGWDPFKVFGDAKGAVTDIGTFLKWIAWIFHPRNLLRMVEFLAGAGLMFMGIGISVKVFGQGDDNTGSKLGTAVALTPPGRAVRGAQAARAGRRQARLAHSASQTADRRTRAHKAESTKLKNKDFERKTGKKRGPQKDIPF